MIKKSLFIIILNIIICNNTICYNLESICKLAINNDSSLLSTIDQQASDREQSFVAFYTLLPSITSAVSFYTNNLNNTHMFENKNFKYQFTFNHQIFNLNNYFNHAQEKYKNNIAIHTVDLLKENILLKTIDQYFSVLITKHELKTSHVKLNLFIIQVNAIKKKYNKTLQALYVIRNIKEKIHIAYIKEILTANALMVEYDRLREMCHTKINKLSDMRSKSITVYPERLNYDKLHHKMVTKNITLKFIKANLDLVKYKINKEKYRYIPTAVLYSTFIKNKQKIKNTRTKTTVNKNLSLTFHIPIMHNQNMHGKRAICINEYNSVEKNYFRQYQQNDVTLKEAYRTFLALNTKRKNIQQAVVAAQITLKLAEIAHKYKQCHITEVLATYFDLINIEKTYANIHYKYISEIIRVKKVIGELTFDNN